MEKILAKRYAFCDFSDIAGFPHPVPTIIEWDDYLPRFRGSKNDHPGEHLFNFHKCMLEHGFVHEDVLIKLFKFSLEENAREWCQSLPAVSIHSLKDFHVAFNSYYEKIYSADLIFDNCCKESAFHIQHSVSIPSDCEDVGDSHIVDTFVIDSNVSYSFDYGIKDATDLDKEVADINSVSQEIQKQLFFPSPSILIILDLESAADIKQSMISTEISLQPFSDLRIAESASLHGKENTQRFFDFQLQQQEKVFLYSLADPFDEYCESLSRTYVNLSLKEGWFCCPVKLHFCMLWFLIFFKSRSNKISVSQFLTWLHWKFSFT
jgi:hypothetical protein